VAATVREFDAFLATTSRPGQKQLLQLFDLLSMPLTRYTVAGLSEDWPEARPAPSRPSSCAGATAVSSCCAALTPR